MIIIRVKYIFTYERRIFLRLSLRSEANSMQKATPNDNSITLDAPPTRYAERIALNRDDVNSIEVCGLFEGEFWTFSGVSPQILRYSQRFLIIYVEF